jgi:hypothetical protein
MQPLTVDVRKPASAANFQSKPASSVTRLGQSSAIGQLFILGSLNKKLKFKLQSFGILFPREIRSVLIFDKKMALGDILGDFKKSSGQNYRRIPKLLAKFSPKKFVLY